MKNLQYKLLKMQGSIAAYARFIIIAMSVFGLFATIATSQTTGGAGNPAGVGATSAICNIFNTVRNLIFLLGITLVILGAAVYAAANIMPSQSKGGFQGYGMGMIIGGIIGVVIAVAAPYILGLIVSANPGGILTSTGSSGVVSLCATTT